MRVYHLLSATHALNDIALRRLRLSRYGDLNDPFELLAANLKDKEVRRAMNGFKRDFHKTKGLLCFSKNWTNPVLWSHYAEKHRGVALGFDIPDAMALEMEYSADRLTPTFRHDAQGFDAAFANRLIRVKYAHWVYEEEVRMVAALDEATVENGSFFYPFGANLQLKEVVLGPLCSLPHDSVRALVTASAGDVCLIKARLAFKSFKVVPDKRFEARPK